MPACSRKAAPTTRGRIARRLVDRPTATARIATIPTKPNTIWFMLKSAPAFGP